MIQDAAKQKTYGGKNDDEKIWDGMFRPKNDLFPQTDDVGGNILHCLFIS